MWSGEQPNTLSPRSGRAPSSRGGYDQPSGTVKTLPMLCSNSAHAFEAAPPSTSGPHWENAAPLEMLLTHTTAQCRG